MPPPGGRRTKGTLGGRSAVVVRKVLDAVVGELARAGYAGFRMDEVAARAGVNRTTVYRRWPNRRALVTDAVARMWAPVRRHPLPDRGALEPDLIEAFARRWTFGRRLEGRAWARLLDERLSPDVRAIVGAAIDERRAEWRAIVTRAIARRELPPETDAQLVLDFVRAIVDARRAARLDPAWLEAAVRTVVEGARAGTLAHASGRVRATGAAPLSRRRAGRPDRA